MNFTKDYLYKSQSTRYLLKTTAKQICIDEIFVFTL